MHHLIATVLASHAGGAKFMGVHHFTQDQGAVILAVLIVAAIAVGLAVIKR